ncbi:hypothetical protein VPH35_022388 [Triticum aestivum]
MDHSTWAKLSRYWNWCARSVCSVQDFSLLQSLHENVPCDVFWPLALKQRRMYWQFKLNLQCSVEIYMCQCFSNDHISAILFGQEYHNSLLLCLAGCICDLLPL